MSSAQMETTLPGGEPVKLRTVTPADEDFLLSVYASSRADELAQVKWQEGQKEAFVKWQFDLQRREYEAKFPDTQYSVILVDDRPAGRFWISRELNEIRLLDIAILPEFQNRGVGTALLRWLIGQARTENKALRHMVFVMNQDAYRFYERLGFVEFEEVGAYKHMEWKAESSRQ
jgi:GNAT superfamily N-acetyltransferase